MHTVPLRGTDPATPPGTFHAHFVHSFPGTARPKMRKQVVESLSKRLTDRYGKGFSYTNLSYFRQFYLAFADRAPILHPPGGELPAVAKQHPSDVKFGANKAILSHTGRELALAAKQYPQGTKSVTGFSPQLSWSHYRALMRVDDPAARDFYEREAAECGWSKAQLERRRHNGIDEK